MIWENSWGLLKCDLTCWSRFGMSEKFVIVDFLQPTTKISTEKPVFRIRIRGSASGGDGSGSDLKSNKFKFFFFLIFSVYGLKLITMFFLLKFWAYYSRILNKISDFFLKKLYFYNFGWFVCEFIAIFYRYPDPDQRFLMRIRIRPNDTDPTGSGSETLRETIE